MELSLEQIRDEVERRAVAIEAPASLLPTYGRTEDGARPHIEVDQLGYHYVIVERGNELERKSSGDLDELLYFVFESITFSMACEYEGRRRRRGEDPRRKMFEHQVELLGKLEPRWARRQLEEQDRTLQEHPFRDDAF